MTVGPDWVQVGSEPASCNETVAPVDEMESGVMVTPAEASENVRFVMSAGSYQDEVSGVMSSRYDVFPPDSEPV